MNPGVLADLPRRRGFSRMDVIGFPSGRFLSAVRMSRSEIHSCEKKPPPVLL